MPSPLLATPKLVVSYLKQTTVLQVYISSYPFIMKKTAGFSLLEVLIAWAILSFTLLALADVLTLELKKTENIYHKTLSELHVNEVSARL